MRAIVGLAIFAVVALSRSCATGQGILSPNWLSDLTRDIDALTKNIARQAQEATNIALTAPSHQAIGTGTVQVVGGGGNVVLSDHQGNKIVRSDRTSDGKNYVYENTNSIVGDTLRTEITIRYPDLNVTKAYGYTLDLKNVDAALLPIQAPAV